MTTNETIESFLPDIERIAGHLCNQYPPQFRDDLMGVARETLCKVAPRVDLGRYPKTYITACVKNQMINFLKRDTRYRVIDEMWPVSRSTKESVEIFDCFYTALKSLPECEKEAFLLYWKGYKYQEMATELEVPVSTVSNWLYQAKTKLQFALIDMGITG